MEDTGDAHQPVSDKLNKPALSAQELARILSPLLLVGVLVLAAHVSFWTIPNLLNFKNFFRNMGTHLPLFTTVVLSIPAGAYWAAIGLVSAVAIIMEFVAKNKRTTCTFNAIAIAAMLVVVLLLHLAMRLPIRQMLNSVQGP